MPILLGCAEARFSRRAITSRGPSLDLPIHELTWHCHLTSGVPVSNAAAILFRISKREKRITQTCVQVGSVLLQQGLQMFGGRTRVCRHVLGYMLGSALGVAMDLCQPGPQRTQLRRGEPNRRSPSKARIT